MGSVVIYSLVHSYLSLYWGEVSKLRLDTVVLSLTCHRDEFLIHRQSRSQSSCHPRAYPLYHLPALLKTVTRTMICLGLLDALINLEMA
jgi:hypothetical protein